ncbi:MAG TPA: hypothetical protein VIW45_06785 [Vicinamibacterales bacterium]|jgi:hypothetical protein
MWTPTIVGHFSTPLAIAWVVWIAWLAGQIVWYRRAIAEPEPAAFVAREPRPAARGPQDIDAKADQPVVLRAPGVALRSMSPVSLRAAQRVADAPAETVDAPTQPAPTTESDALAAAEPGVKSVE